MTQENILRRRKTNRANAIAILVGYTLFFVIALSQLLAIIQLSAFGVLTRATVISVSSSNKRSSKSGRGTSYITYRISIDNHKPVEKNETVSRSYSLNYQKNDSILVRYVSYNPTISRIYGNEDIVLATILALLGVAGLGMLVKYLL